MDWKERIANYDRTTGFPHSLFIAGDGRVVGTWIMGNDYRVKSHYTTAAILPDTCDGSPRCFPISGASCTCSAARSIWSRCPATPWTLTLTSRPCT